MLYLLALICPPLAVLLCGKSVQFILSIVLTLCFWIPGVIHALGVVSSTLSDRRTDRVIDEIQGNEPIPFVYTAAFAKNIMWIIGGIILFLLCLLL